MQPILIRSPQGDLAASAWRAETWAEKARGWLGRKDVSAGEALLLPGAGSIHSFGMAFEFDLLFLDGRSRILALHPRMRPWRLAWAPLRHLRGGVQALELPAGALENAGWKVGEALEILPR